MNACKKRVFIGEALLVWSGFPVPYLDGKSDRSRLKRGVFQIPDKRQVDVGFEKPIQIVSSLVPYYTAEEIKDTKLIVLVNLEPAKFRGEVSEGMLLCAEKESENKVVLLTVEKDIDAGSPVT